jgi:seryl-tRNA(Sec) selenium transferase
MCTTTALTEFEQANLQAFKELAFLTESRKELEKKEKDIKETLLKGMEEHGIKSIDNEIVKITYIEPSESVSIDTKAFLAADPDLYREVEEKYNKRTTRKASVRVTVR